MHYYLRFYSNFCFNFLIVISTVHLLIVHLFVDKEESFRATLVSMDEEASKFGLRVSWTKIQNLGILSIIVKLRIYSTCVLPILLYGSEPLRPGPSYKPTWINWTHSMYGAYQMAWLNVHCPAMKFCVVPACSTSRTSFSSEDWVSLGTSPDFDAMYQQTRSYKSAPSRGMLSGLIRSGEAPVVDDRPPGPTRSAATQVLRWLRPCS